MLCLHRACINVDGMDSTRSTVVLELSVCENHFFQSETMETIPSIPQQWKTHVFRMFQYCLGIFIQVAQLVKTKMCISFSRRFVANQNNNFRSWTVNWNMLYNFKSHFDRCIQLAVVVVHLITYILGTIILKHIIFVIVFLPKSLA